MQGVQGPDGAIRPARPRAASLLIGRLVPEVAEAPEGVPSPALRAAVSRLVIWAALESSSTRPPVAPAEREGEELADAMEAPPFFFR